MEQYQSVQCSKETFVSAALGLGGLLFQEAVALCVSHKNYVNFFFLKLLIYTKEKIVLDLIKEKYIQFYLNI